MTRALEDLERELELLGGTNIILSTNLELRLDGLPRANQRIPDDAGACVYFDLEGKDQAIPCDQWDRVEDNIYAIAKTINALRGIERWGAKELLNAAFRGFKALPENAGKGSIEAWWDVLEVDPHETTEDEVIRAYKAKAREAHPDRGGSKVGWAVLLAAKDQALAAVRG